MKFKIISTLVLLFCMSLAQAQCPTGLYVYKAHVVSAYDADTITVNVDLGFNMWVHNEKLRLNRINAPEVRGSQRPQGLIARDWLRKQIVGKTIMISTIRDKKGKYGRYLAEIFNSECKNLNDELVKRKLAIYQSY